MAARTVLLKWIGEFCAPVVVTVVTAEAEAISLKNGLLLHELLSSFGHLDSLNTTVRSGNANIHISDAHIRFERVTELKPKTGELLEEMLNKSFEEFDMTRLPSSAAELKSNPPTGWNSTTEQLVMRSMAFSEYEMISHPVVILTVVATTDVDQIACMQELISAHHTPTLFSNGQYEPQIHRVFVLLHDATADKKIDPNGILKKMQAKFTNVTISLLTINSFPVNQPNLQQPDMWSRFVIPKYFPQHAPNVEAAIAALPVNPVTKQPVLGCRLSMEDFMTLQSFCMNLFNQEIVPTIEKRLYFLQKQVNDARKGMKNLMKSFWRKPREDDGPKGSVKYRFDKVEAQILLLADLSFAIKDFDTAISMYKLVRDDFKSDKSMLHLAHSSLMLAACYLMTEPNKSKDLHANLEALSQVLATAVEVPHANAYFALLGSEMYVYHHAIRAPLEAAKFLLQAAANLARYPLLSSLLTERAGGYFLQAGQTRRYIFNIVFAANRMLRCGPRAVNHAAVCHASAMLILDKGNWGDLKAKLTRSLANYLKLSGRDGAQRALLMMLKMLHALVNDTSDVGNRGSIGDAINVFNEIVEEGAWGSILIGEGWKNCSSRDIILGVLPLSPMNILDNDISKNRSLVVGFSMPALDTASTMILNSLNGCESSNDSITATATAGNKNSALQTAAIEEMLMHLEVELQWVAEQEAVVEGSVVSTKSRATTTAGGADSGPKSLADKLAEAESDLQRTRNNKSSSEVVRVPLGEEISVRLKMANKLPLDVKMSKLGLIIEPEQSFVATETDLTLMPDELSREVVLRAKPLAVGQYTVDSAKWSLSEFFSVRQPLRREGALLQRTLQQRVRRERGEDRSMLFEVIPSHPLLRISFEGLSAEVLQGQLLKSSLVLRNEGAAAACDVYLKLSQPSFVLYSAGKLLPFIGQSSTVVRLDPSMVIAPGQEVRFDAWLRVTKPGLQTISLLASYKALREDGTKDFFGPGQRCRSSYISIQTRGVPAVGVTMRLMPKASSAKHHTLVAEMANFLRPPANNAPIENVRLSIGQLDLGNFHEFIDIEDCGVKVVGMQMLGAALPFAYKSIADSASSSQPPAAQLLAAPAERVVGCYPVKIVDNYQSCGVPSLSSSPSLGSCSWLLPLQESIFSGGGKDSFSQQQLLEVMEQFMCIAFSADQFEKDVEEARRLIRIAEMEADESGPRTISQVRKDNAKLRDAANRLGNLGTIDEEDTDSDGDDLTDVPLDASSPGATNATSMYGNADSERGGLVTNPSGIKDIAFNEAISQSVTVALLWICRWEGKIRWGMQNVSNLSFINQATVTSSTVTSSKPKYAADYLLVGIAHAQHIEVPAGGNQDGSAALPAHVVVTITLQCVHDSPIFVNLDALSSELDSATPAAVAAPTPDSAKKAAAAAPPVLPLLEKASNTGLKWGGQTKFSGVCVPAHGVIELKLFALLYKPGVYDLKRFAIAASFKKDVPVKSYSLKQISGQSLIKVVESAISV